MSRPRTSTGQSAWADRLAEQFRRQQRDGRFPGGQLVVRRRGEILFEVAVGIARGWRGDEGVPAQPVDLTTRFQVMSVSKALVGFAVALLEDRGLIEVDAPVARYFPAFAANGKVEITVRDVLTHRSGLVLDSLVARPALWSDWPALLEAVAAARPEHPRGTLAYESHAFGWVLAEVLRRVTGRSLPELLAETLPAELGEFAFFGPAAATPPPARPYWLGRPHHRLGGLDLADGFEAVNDTITCQQALVPGAGLITTARSLAAFYDLILAGGETPSGQRVIRAEVLRAYVTRQTAGRDRVTGAYLVLGRGFALGWPLPHPYGWWGSSRCFGHAGGFGCLAFADPDRSLSIAILTNGHRSIPDLIRRFAPLSHRARHL